MIKVKLQTLYHTDVECEKTPVFLVCDHIILKHQIGASTVLAGLQIFFKIGWAKWPMEQKMVGHFLKWWAQAYQTNHVWHLSSLLYLLTDTDTCIHICIFTADYTVNPVLSGDQLSLNAGQKQGEHSAILSTFIKLPFVIKIFVLSFFEWLLKTCFTVLTTYMYFLFCEFCRLAIRWIFFIKVRYFHNQKGWVHWAHCLGKWWAILWNHRTMTRAHHKSEGLL